MRRAAKAFAGARKSADRPGVCFEPLEPRLVLSAPTATPLAPIFQSSTGVLFPIQYHSDTPIDQSTLGDDDIVVTGPNGFAQLAGRGAIQTASNGDLVVHYWVSAPHSYWDWHTDNGTYNVGIPADAVRNTAGEGNAAAGVGSYWFWFTPQLSLENSRNLTGQGPTASDGWGIFTFGSSGDAWLFDVGEVTTYPSYGVGVVIHVTGPNGYDRTTIASFQRPYRGLPQERLGNAASGAVPAPGGTWDFSDNGVYTVELGDLSPDSSIQNPRIGHVMLTQIVTQSLAAGPRAEVTSSTFGARDWVVAVRYTAPPGSAIDATTISDVDIEGYFANAPQRELAATLLRPPTANSDGSVTAVYRIQSPGVYGWTGDYGGPATIWTRPGEVMDMAGRSVGIGAIGTGRPSVDRPTVIEARTVSAVVNAWDVELTFSNAGGLAGTLTPSGSNLSVYADINGVYQLAPLNVQYVSSATANDTLAVRYRITPRQGFLWDGTFTVQMNPQTMFSVGWGLNLTQAFVMHFAGPSVQGLRTLTRTNTSWDLELAFDNPGSLISASSLSAQNLIVAAPGGRTMRISLVSVANSDGVLRVRYRITSVNAGTALPHGTYGFSLRNGSVIAAGVALPGQFLANMTI